MVRKIKEKNEIGELKKFQESNEFEKAQTGKKIERLPITNDYIFKRVFAYEGNESILKDLLEAILKIDIQKIEIKNPEIVPFTKEEKRGLLDIKVRLDNGTIIDIEMQIKNEKNTEERSTMYLGKMISEQLQSGEEYNLLKKSIVIFITNYNFLKRNSYHNVGKMKFDDAIKEEYVDVGYVKEDEIASKYLEIHYIELPKFVKRNPEKYTKLDQWMCLFTQNREGIEMAEKENKEIKRAVRALDFISADEKERERYNSIIMAEYNRKVTEGKVREEGIEVGKKEGAEEEKIKIAKEMIKKKFPIEIIVEVTKLSKEKIIEIQSEN